MSKAIQSPEDNGAGTPQAAGPPKREVAQATLSVIGDVSVATSDAMSQMSAVPKETVWKPIIIFSVVAYSLSVAAAWPLAQMSSPWLRALLVPLVPVFCAIATFWWRQKWKFRAKEWKFKLKVWQEALDSVGYEVVNSINAVRANLIGFRLANPDAPMAEHLDVIEEAVHRMDRVIRKAQDPVEWWQNKKKKPSSADPSSIGEDTRARINL